MSENEIRRYALEIQNYEAQQNAIERRIEILLATINELEVTSYTLENLKKENPDQEILAPIGSSSYIKAKISTPDKVLMGLGANVVAEIDTDKALEKINERKKNFQKIILELRGQLQQIQSKINEIRAKLQEILSKKGGKQG
ncbi:MAG: prefoldin subunit alpha [Candidatus Odinarchaeia archaeon]